MYAKWKRDPNSVHSSFQAYFSNLENGVESPYAAPPTLGQRSGGADIHSTVQQVLAALGSKGLERKTSNIDVTEGIQIMNMMRAYQEAGHEAADLDPLKLPWAEQHGKHDVT